MLDFPVVNWRTHSPKPEQHSPLPMFATLFGDEIILTTLSVKFIRSPQRNWTSHLARFELSRLCCHSHSLLLSSYLSRFFKPSCSACGHHLQVLTHLLLELDCPTSEPLRRAIFGTTFSIFYLWSRPWGVALMLGLRGVSPRPHRSKGIG